MLIFLKKNKPADKPIWSKNITQRQKALGISSVEKLAEMAELPYPTVRDIVGGLSEGNFENRERIAKVLKCSIADLYSGARGSERRISDLTLNELEELVRRASTRDGAINMELERLRKLIRGVPEELLTAWRSDEVEPVQRWLCLYILTWDDQYADQIAPELWKKVLKRLSDLGVRPPKRPS